MKISEFRLQVILCFLIIISGVIYVNFHLSPSHYGVVLEQYLGLDTNPIAGKAKIVRGDEYSVVTPYFQIAVNNDFKRYNQHSPYKEDLRFFYGLPLTDWALAFKPYMWGFWVLDAARAYSLYHYFMIAMFLIGYSIFFRALKLPLFFSILLTAILFFSQHNQVWWSTNAPIFALTIWIVLPFLFKWPYYLKFLVTCYLSFMALAALIYPPWQITLIYMFGIFALAFRREKFTIPNILVSLFGFLLAAALYYYYQQDSIALMLNTVYPGERSLPGGYLPKYYLWAFFSPHSLINKDFFAISDIRNMCEIAVVGSIIIPSVLCFSNFKSLFQIIRRQLWSYSLIIGFIFILFAWMYLPVPASIGQFILFDQINVLRILLTFGSSAIILSAMIAYQQQWNFSWFRFILFAVLTLSPPFLAHRHITKEPIQNNLFESYEVYDYLTLLPLLAIILILGFYWFYHRFSSRLSSNGTKLKLTESQSTIKNKQIAYALMVTALLFNVISFAHFNPLQSTKDIFSKELQETVTQLKKDLNLDGEDTVLYQSNLPYLQTGSILNGLNIPSFNHALLTPQLDFYKKLLPEANPDSFNQALNRYAKTQFSNQYLEAKAIHFDVVGLPTEVAAQKINVTLNSVPEAQKSTCPTCTSIYPHELQWKRVDDTNLQLLLNFTSPIIIDDMSSMIEINLADNESNDDLNISAKTIAEVNLPWYFSEASLDVQDISKWNLYITFNTTDPNALEKIQTLIRNIGIRDLDTNKLAFIQLQKDIRVEEISAQNDSLKLEAQPTGYIDIANYNPASGIISLEGWTPVEDTQSARWIGYSSDLKIQILESKTVFRPGVPSEFGKNPYKGFKLILKVPPHSNTSLPLCLYSSTQTLGTFSIYSGNVPFLKCSVEAELSAIQKPTQTLQMNGVIDHVRLGNQNKSIVLIGWAAKNTLDDIVSKRWFGYSSSLSPISYQISSQPRPDVAKVHGDTYAMSGFQITLNFPEAITTTTPIELCLFSRNQTSQTSKGQFYIRYSQNQSIFYCEH